MKTFSFYNFIKIKSLLFFLLILFGFSFPVQANDRDRGIPSQIYLPAFDHNGFLNIESPTILPPFRVDFLIGYNFATSPMVLDFTQAPTNEDKTALRYQSAFDFLITMSFGKYLQMTLYQPFYHQGLGMTFNMNQEWGFIYNEPYNTMKHNPPKSVPGDTNVFFKFKLYSNNHFSSALGINIFLPFGVEEVFAGEHSVAVKPVLLLGYNYSKFSLITNLGYLWRKDFQIKDPVDDTRILLEAGQEIHASVGVKFKVNKSISLVTSLSKYIPVSSLDNTDSPNEVDAGIIWNANSSVSVQIFAGSDANTSSEYGRGTPFRVGAYLYWHGGKTKNKVVVGDTDKDGISDDKDMCPNSPEDLDKFEDSDGCPEPDNDMDGIPDKLDKCPNSPEDLDKFEDSDGCPDPDNDHDGIPDNIDRCAGTDADKSTSFIKTKEDIDHFEDSDGCPDPDNDHDGIPDKLDRCPNQKETVNGIDDTDGCPDISKGLSVKGGQILLKGNISFERGKAIIKKSSYPVLLRIANFLKSNTSIRLVRIEGHTDNKGSKSKNIYLSTARAASVRNYLISKGVAPLRLQAVGYGSKYPIKPNTSSKNRKANRRVEFIIVYQ